jgi:hypothetical protein
VPENVRKITCKYTCILSWCFSFVVFLFLRQSHYVAQAGLKLAILLLSASLVLRLQAWPPQVAHCMFLNVFQFSVFVVVGMEPTPTSLTLDLYH